jgi:hypothetical protein
MTVHCTGDVIFLEGVCPVEDAEDLLVLLQEKPDRQVDLSLCERPHSAVVQVMLAASPKLCGADPQGFLQEWIVSTLKPGTA